MVTKNPVILPCFSRVSLIFIFAGGLFALFVENLSLIEPFEVGANVNYSVNFSFELSQVFH